MCPWKRRFLFLDRRSLFSDENSRSPIIEISEAVLFYSRLPWRFAVNDSVRFAIGRKRIPFAF